MQKEDCPTRQEWNCPTIDPCFEPEEDKDREIQTHRINKEIEIMIMEMETMETKNRKEIMKIN